MEPQHHTDLKPVLQDAISAALRKLTRSQAEGLRGFGFYTDDGVSTLSCALVTAADLASRPDPDLLFTPTDWPLTPFSTAAVSVTNELRSRYGATVDLRAHVVSHFALLVGSLRSAKEQGLFSDDVFLTVFSGDPSDFLEHLEGEAIKTLNTPMIVDQWDQFQDKWS